MVLYNIMKSVTRPNCCSLAGCVLISDSAAVALRNSCHSLSVLDLGYTALSTHALLALFLSADHATSTSAAGVFGSIGRLSSVCLRSTVANDDVVQCICESAIGSLQDLDIGGCIVSDRSLAALILHASSSLRRLNVSFVRTISEAVLGSLVAECRAVDELEVWGCSQLTDTFFDNQWQKELSVKGRVGRNGT